MKDTYVVVCSRKSLIGSDAELQICMFYV